MDKAPDVLIEEIFGVNRYTLIAALSGIANVAFLLFARWEIDPLEYSDG